METVIEINNLKKSYGEKIAVDNICLQIGRGMIFGLLGANGAGKSTTIECVLGTKNKDSGEIKILGMNPKQDRKKLFEKVGVQFQDCAYQALITVSELCEITACVYREALDYKELLQKFGLQGKEKAKVSSLSGGERQRLFIVLALLSNPEIVFLDELTTGLDTIARKEVWKFLLDLKKKGLTIFLTSHYMDEVEKLCDKIAILKHGKLVFCGTTMQAVEMSKQATFEDAYEWFIKEDNERESKSI